MQTHISKVGGISSWIVIVGESVFKFSLYCSDFELMQRQRGKYYEIVYRDYTQQHPWGKTPEDEWTNSTCTYPDILRGGDGYTRIPITTVCHVTHDREAALIHSSLATQQCYTFKPAQKLGKQYGDDRLPLGETYRHIERRIFGEIPRSENDPVFSGYYLWWGISVSEWYKERGEHLAEQIQQLKRQGTDVAEFLTHEPKSRYGNNAFTIKFSTLLLSYKRSCMDIEERRHIMLRVGGTLRYKKEICYVVIVCLQQDHTFNDLVTIDKVDIIDHNGLVNKGKVVDYWQMPEFKAKYVVTRMRDCGGQYNGFSWEQAVFALYYPREDLTLRCKVDDINERCVEHSFCISTQSGKCPNDIN